MFVPLKFVPLTVPVAATELGVIAPNVKARAGVVVGVATVADTPFCVVRASLFPKYRWIESEIRTSCPSTDFEAAPAPSHAGFPAYDGGILLPGTGRPEARGLGSV